MSHVRSLFSHLPYSYAPLATILYHFRWPWPWRGHKVSVKQNLLALYSLSHFNSSGWNFMWCWSNSNWTSWYHVWVRFNETREIAAVLLTATNNVGVWDSKCSNYFTKLFIWIWIWIWIWKITSKYPDHWCYTTWGVCANYWDIAVLNELTDAEWTMLLSRWFHSTTVLQKKEFRSWSVLHGWTTKHLSLFLM